ALAFLAAFDKSQCLGEQGTRPVFIHVMNGVKGTRFLARRFYPCATIKQGTGVADIAGNLRFCVVALNRLDPFPALCQPLLDDRAHPVGGNVVAARAGTDGLQLFNFRVQRGCCGAGRYKHRQAGKQCEGSKPGGSPVVWGLKKRHGGFLCRECPEERYGCAAWRRFQYWIAYLPPCHKCFSRNRREAALVLPASAC